MVCYSWRKISALEVAGHNCFFFLCDILKIPGTSLVFLFICLLTFSVYFRGFEVSYSTNLVALCLYKCLFFYWRKEVKKNLDEQSCSFYNEPWHNMLQVFPRLTISFQYAWFFGHFQSQYTYRLHILIPWSYNTKLL